MVARTRTALLALLLGLTCCCTGQVGCLVCCHMATSTLISTLIGTRSVMGTASAIWSVKLPCNLCSRQQVWALSHVARVSHACLNKVIYLKIT